MDSNLRLVNLESLAQFRAEVSLLNPVRLSLTHLHSGQSPFITETWYLRLQGWLNHTDLGQLTQLFQVQLGPGGEPLHPQGQALREALARARELVQAYLAAAGYSVRGGFYAMPDDLKPLNASFECLEWDRDREAETVNVRLVAAAACEANEPAPTNDAGAVTLLPHRAAELEGLAAAFADAEADFLAQYKVTTCPYCGEETALVTPAGRLVCPCWTNPAQEVVDDLQSSVDDAPKWELFHEDNLPGDWPEELGIHLRRGTADVEVRITPYSDCLSLELLDSEGTPYEMEVSLTVVEPDGVKLGIKNRDARVSTSGGTSCSACSK